MKTAAKVFIVIGLILRFCLIFPIVLGAIALKKLKASKKKEDFGTGWAVTVLILVGIVAGILLLVMKDEDFQMA